MKLEKKRPRYRRCRGTKYKNNQRGTRPKMYYTKAVSKLVGLVPDCGPVSGSVGL